MSYLDSMAEAQSSIRRRLAGFRDPDRALDGFDFAFNKNIDHALVYELATARFVAQHEDALLIGCEGTKGSLNSKVQPWIQLLGDQNKRPHRDGPSRDARHAAVTPLPDEIGVLAFVSQRHPVLPLSPP